MLDLTRHGSPVASVFDLLGTNENDLTSALGFALSRSPALLSALLRRLWPQAGVRAPAVSLALEVRGDPGRTDLQIELPDALLIVEAKRGWMLPTTRQLTAYAPRVRRHGGGALVTLSQASAALARVQLPAQVDGIPVLHLSWHEVLTDIAELAHERRGQERMWLEELARYLRGVVRLRSIADSWTYCVVLNDERPR